MTAIDLNPGLFEQVRRIARWQRVTTDELTLRALSSYLDRIEGRRCDAQDGARLHWGETQCAHLPSGCRSRVTHTAWRWDDPQHALILASIDGQACLTFHLN